MSLFYFSAAGLSPANSRVCGAAQHVRRFKEFISQWDKMQSIKSLNRLDLPAK